MKETPNGPFPGYVEQRPEKERQYLDRIFSDWLQWVNANTPTPQE